MNGHTEVKVGGESTRFPVALFIYILYIYDELPIIIAIIYT